MFEIVLYYQKRVSKGDSVGNFIKSKNVDVNTISQSEMNDILDEYSKKNIQIYREKIVDTFILINEDENFLTEVSKIEKSEGFIKWEDVSLAVIKNSY